MKDALHQRLINLRARELVARDGNTYTIASAGLTYATAMAVDTSEPIRPVLNTIKVYNQAQRQALLDELASMHPYRFEGLVRDLLEAMGYEDVTVTQQTGDKGVDVVASVQFGITTITEVVQVKRQKGATGRPVVDQLRGALPYHNAIWGTIITTGGFSKSCTNAALFPNAAPITLIDGAKLLDLLIEHEIGVRKVTISLYELDREVFAEPDEIEDIAEELVDQSPGNADDL